MFGSMGDIIKLQ
jgi:hypothetical protein